MNTCALIAVFNHEIAVEQFHGGTGFDIIIVMDNAHIFNIARHGLQHGPFRLVSVSTDDSATRPDQSRTFVNGECRVMHVFDITFPMSKWDEYIAENNGFDEYVRIGSMRITDKTYRMNNGYDVRVTAQMTNIPVELGRLIRKAVNAEFTTQVQEREARIRGIHNQIASLGRGMNSINKMFK